MSRRLLMKTFWIAAVLIVIWGALTLLVVALDIQRPWSGGIGGFAGALVLPWAWRFFDRRWPKPKAGWVE